MFLTWPDLVDKNFRGRTKMFSTIAENIYHRIKFSGGQFFLDIPSKIKSQDAGFIEIYISRKFVRIAMIDLLAPYYSDF